MIDLPHVYSPFHDATPAQSNKDRSSAIIVHPLSSPRNGQSQLFPACRHLFGLQSLVFGLISSVHRTRHGAEECCGRVILVEMDGGDEAKLVMS